MSQHQRLILVTPLCTHAQDLAPALTRAMAAGRIDAVILRLGEGDDRSLINCVKTLGPIVQEAGAALLLCCIRKNGLGDAGVCAPAMMRWKLQSWDAIMSCSANRLPMVD